VINELLRPVKALVIGSNPIIPAKGI